MGQVKKSAKGRLDKFYHLAKDQGYRARSAFKLIQLNKKFEFLETAKCCIDLCAAPGGWLQVAQKYMPKPSLIIGLDLEKIKAIPGVITRVEDITTAQCRATLKKEMKTWKADVVLHDGAPNVGVSWIQDAFTQSELVLAACKLATEFLVPGGTFVTKVFRSKDYNKLIWVFNQLFGRVEATKPSASRNVSAEIFVVCRDFMAPKKIDARLLDPKFAFKEVDDVPAEEGEVDAKKLKSQRGAVLNDLMNPTKRKRHRDGYEDGNYTLYTTHTVGEFITSADFLGILARSSALVYDSKNELDQKVKESGCCTADLDELIKDLKVLGKKDFQHLIRWRDQVRVVLGLVVKKSEEVVEEEPGSDEEDIETRIERAQLEQSKLLKKKKKKQRERRLKLTQRLMMGMDTPFDVGLEASQAGLEGLPEFDFGDENPDSIAAAAAAPNGEFSKNQEMYSSDEDHSEMEQDLKDDDEEDDDVYMDSDEELINKIHRLDTHIDSMYQEYERQKLERNPTLKARKVKESSAAFEEWYGLESDRQSGITTTTDQAPTEKTEFDSSSGDDSSDSENQVEETTLSDDGLDAPTETMLSKKARMFFDNPLFESLDDGGAIGGGESLFTEELSFQDTGFNSDDEPTTASNEPKKKRKRGKNAEKYDDEEMKESKGFEVVPATVFPANSFGGDDDDDDEDGPIIDTAQGYTLASRMITKSGKRDVLDEAYNRYAFNDPEGLPDWFMNDEGKHNKPTLPVTKEAVLIMREKMKALDARPIKKIAEAKFRKQLRTQRRLMKAANKSQGLADQEDISERSKLEEAAKVMSKAKKSVRTEKDKVKVVVAKGTHKAIKGRPKGVKGRYKMVDGPMKKESRALKRVANKHKKRRK